MVAQPNLAYALNRIGVNQLRKGMQLCIFTIPKQLRLYVYIRQLHQQPKRDR